MKYERMMECNLANHGMGLEKVSDVDFLVFADDQILVDHYNMKEKIGDRYQATKDAKKHLQKLAKYAKVEIRANSGKVIDWGDKSYEKGKKVYTRVNNYKWTVEEDVDYAISDDYDSFDYFVEIQNYHLRNEIDKDRHSLLGNICYEDLKPFWESKKTERTALFEEVERLQNQLVELKNKISSIWEEIGNFPNT